jgi:hypothetical protein
MRNGFAGAAHHLDQEAQFGWDAVVLALFFNEVLGQADAFHYFPRLVLD